MPLLLARGGEEFTPLGRYFFDLMLKLTSVLPIIMSACFVAADVQLNEMVGDLLRKGAFFGGRHFLTSFSLRSGLLLILTWLK
jgi:hypothetical protein